MVSDDDQVGAYQLGTVGMAMKGCIVDMLIRATENRAKGHEQHKSTANVSHHIHHIHIYNQIKFYNILYRIFNDMYMFHSQSAT